LDNIDLELIRNEVEVLTLNKHKYVINLITSFENHEFFYIVTEYFEKSICLVDYMKNLKFNLNANKTKTLLKKVYEVINFMHTNGVICRNIKTENILITDEKDSLDIRFINFRFSKYLGKNQFIVNEPFGAMVSKLNLIFIWNLI